MYIVAEGGCNHMGRLEVALEMTRTAKLCGANYIKWQKRNPTDCVPFHLQNLPHPDSHNAYGDTYLHHRQALELSKGQHAQLREYAKNIDIGYGCSVWDLQSATDIISLQPDFVKIPSAHNTNYELIKRVFDLFPGSLHISTGMLTRNERAQLYNFLKPYKDRLVIYHTTTEYPCPFEHLYLKEIIALKEYFPVVGYSGHNYGIAVDIAAATLGASWIERHFTMDRTSKGTDHAASLEPDGLRRVVRDMIATEKALQYRTNDMTDEEVVSRKKLKGM